MTKLERIARAVEENHPQEVQDPRQSLACNYNVPAQRQINMFFARINVTRFPGGGNDVWEMMEDLRSGHAYTAPGERLCAQWGSY